MYINKLSHKGIIALTTLILITAILLFSGITLLLTSIDLSTSTEGFANNAIARIYMTTCLEEAMQRLNKDITYQGTINMTFVDGSCQSITSATEDPTKKSIAIVSVSGEFTSNDSFTANISADPIEVVD